MSPVVCQGLSSVGKLASYIRVARSHANYLVSIQNRGISSTGNTKGRKGIGGVSYAVMLRFDASTEKLITSYKSLLTEKLRPTLRAADIYAPHITLAIFDDLVTPQLEQLLKRLAVMAHALSIEFCATGFFGMANRKSLFLSVAPSRQLLEVHRAVHVEFAQEKPRDSFYNVDRWLPHCTIVSGLDAVDSIDSVFGLIPRQLLLTEIPVMAIELVFAADITSGPVDALVTAPIDHFAY